MVKSYTDVARHAARTQYTPLIGTLSLARLFRYFAIPTLCAFCIGCAGFRGGWESVAYVDDMPSSAALAGLRSSLRADKPELNLPGVKLHVSIDNQLRTYDTQIIFGLPLSVDPRNVYPKNHKPGKTRVFVNVVPQTDGFVFQAHAGVACNRRQAASGNARIPLRHVG